MHKPQLGQHGAPGNLAGWLKKAVKVDRGEQLGVPSCGALIQSGGRRP